jgi:hypothetical protein
LGIVCAPFAKNGLLAAVHLDFHKEAIENTTPGGKFSAAA